MAHTPDISISIVSFNTNEVLRSCLDSIFHNNGDVAVEVIVVDNASTDGSVEMVEHEFPQASLIRNERNLMFTKANNQAIRRSRAPYVLILNSDTRLPRGMLREMIDFMESHPKAGAASCNFLSPEGAIQPVGWKFHTLGSMMANQKIARWLFPNSRVLREHSMPDWDRTSSRQVDVICGG